MNAGPYRTTLHRLLLVGVLAGIAVQSGTLRSIDTVRRLQWTRSLWTSAPEVVDTWPEFGLLDDSGHIHAWWGPGQSLLFVPSDMLSVAIVRASHVPAIYAGRVQRAVVGVTFYPIVTGLCVIAAFWWLSVIGLSISQATFGSLALLFGTTLLYWTQGGQENSLMLLLTLVSSAGAAHWAKTGNQKSAVLAMAALGFTILIRPQTFGGACIGVATSLIAFRAEWRRAPRGVITRGLAIACSILLAFVLCERAFHYWRFHELWGTYLGRFHTWVAAHPELPSNWPLITPFLEGFLGQTVSGASIFLFEPLLGLLLVVFLLFRKSAPPATPVVAAGLMVTLFVEIAAHAKLPFWYGGNSWGPRYITVPAEMCGALAVGVLASIWRQLSRMQKLAAGLIAAAAVSVQLSSVVFDDSLELVQAVRGTPLVVQRFNNIWKFLSTNDVQTLHWRSYPAGIPHVSLFPWVGRLYLGPTYGTVALWVWGLIVAAMAMVVIKLVRVRDGVHVRHSEHL